MLRISWVLALCLLLIALAGCGGNSSTNSGAGGGNTLAPAGNNVASIEVNAGPPELQVNGGTVNTAFMSVQLCVPGTSNCQTIDFVDVDTGSSGLRVLASKMQLPLPASKDSSGNTLANCAQFVDGFAWGPIAIADIVIPGTGQKASSVPIQIVDDTNSFATVPGSCSASSPGSDNSVQGLGAYAIIGVGNFRQDCGLGCTPLAGANNPGLYYSCTSSSCNQTAVTIEQQLQNPVAMFPTDNNGVIVELPSIPATGAATVTGSLVFGIGTESNNSLNGATQLTLDSSGGLTTIFGSPAQGYPGSFIDSGSNGLYFLNSSLTGLPTCPSNPSFYCPTTPQTLTATNQGTNGTSSKVTFNIANASTLSAAFTAFDNLGGTNDVPTPAFDFGLPFFFGRNVFTGFEGVSNGQPTDTGQFVAY